MRPTVGRDVHYVSYGTPHREDGSQAYESRCRAAKVTNVHGLAMDREGDDVPGVWDVDLAVFNPTGLFFDEHCVQHESPTGDHRPGSWHWPERIADE